MRASNINGVTGALLTTTASSLFSSSVFFSLSWFMQSSPRVPFGEDAYMIGFMAMGIMCITFPLALWLLRKLPIGRANVLVLFSPVLATSVFTPLGVMAGSFSIPIATVLSLIYCKRKIVIANEAVI